MDTPFLRSVARLIKALEGTSDEWWIIGGAATALIEGRIGEPRDIDVLLSPRGALGLIKTLQLPDLTDGGTERFRSQVFATWHLPVPVDLLGGFEVLIGNEWKPVVPQTRRPVETGAGIVFLPSREEHIEIAAMLGRPKDLELIADMTSFRT